MSRTERGRDRGASLVHVWELSRVFFVIGLTSFGMAILQNIRSVPVRRGWLEQEEIDEGLAVVQLYPGAIMVDLVAFIGYRVRGVRGAIAATVGFVTPALGLLLALSWAYWSYGTGPQFTQLAVGLNAIVVGVIAHVTLDFASRNLAGRLPAILACGGFAAIELGANPLWAVLGGLVVGAIALRRSDEGANPSPDETSPTLTTRRENRRRLEIASIPTLTVVGGALDAAVAGGVLAVLVIEMLKIGTVAFGNGATILPILQHDVVDTHHWVTRSQLGVGIGFGQITPGPMLITATFVGFHVAGWWGGILAAVAIFAPSVAMTTLAAETYRHFRRYPVTHGALRGVMAVFVGLLATVLVTLGAPLLATPAAVMLAAGAFVAVRSLRWNPIVVFAAGLTAWALYLAATGRL